MFPGTGLCPVRHLPVRTELLKLFWLLACAVGFCSTGSRSLHLRCPGEVASMKARLLCLIRRHQWHRNDYEYPTVWTGEVAYWT